MFKGIYREKRVHQGDLRSVLQRARQCGVERIMVTAGSLTEVLEAAQLTKDLELEFPGMLSTTVGVHPTRVSEISQYQDGPDVYIEELRSLARRHKELNIKAIGEFGLG